LPKFARIAGVIALILPTAGIPLGLGDIELHSALNQPLDADIGLLDVRSTPLDNIQVSLASSDEFEKMGLDRPSFLSSLEMELRQDASGRQIIKLTSPQAIREPFIDVLLAVSWAQGRLVKEYTLLLDPPVFLDASAAPINAPWTDVAASDEGVSTPASEVVPTQAAVIESVQESTQESAASKPGFSREAGGALSYGPVQRSDTLWSIAQTYKSEDGASTPQVMMALLRDNPDAFYDQNVNELKAGYVLRIQHPEAVSAMSRAAAEAEIRRQYSAWRAAKEGRPINAPPADAATRSNVDQDTSIDEGAKSGPRLELSSAESGNAGSTAGVATSDGLEGSASATGMRADLLVAIEASDVAQQENKALRDRLAILEKQMVDMRRLLVLKGDTLTALQAKGTEVIVPSADINAADADVAPATFPETVGDTTAVVAVASQPEENAAPEQGIVDQLLGKYLWYVVSGAGVLVLLLALFAKRRQGMKDALDLAAEYPDIEEPVTEISVPGVGPAATEGSSEVAETGPGEVTAESLLSDVQSSQYDDSSVEDDDIDTLSEADVYLAYRRFDKAEQLLSDALQAEPDRQDIQLKLLEVYAKSENKEAFVLRAEAFQVLLSDDESEVWRKVEKLGRPLLGSHSLFGDAPEEPVEAFSDAEPLVEVAAAADTTTDVEDTQPAMEESNSSLATDLNGPDLTVTDEENMEDQRDIPLEFEIAALEERLASPEESETEASATEIEVGASTDDLSDVVAAEHQENAVAPEVETFVAEAKAQQDEDGADDDMAWLDEVVETDLDDLIGGGEDMVALEEDMDLAGPISGEDNFATNLDLARAYIDMGDMEAARAILEGLDDSLTDVQRAELQDLMKQIA